MMLELLMTRQNTLDQAVVSNATDLDFIVLDELHTYRARQGADVAGAAKIFAICAEGQGIRRFQPERIIYVRSYSRRFQR